MQVSAHTRYLGEAAQRVQARRPMSEDSDNRDRRVHERLDDGSRRQNTAARRPRPPSPRPSESDERQIEPASFANQRVTWAETAPPTSSLDAPAEAAEFWSLLGAVAPDKDAANRAVNLPSGLAKRPEPSLHELIAQAIASN